MLWWCWPWVATCVEWYDGDRCARRMGDKTGDGRSEGKPGDLGKEEGKIGLLAFCFLIFEFIGSRAVPLEAALQI